MMMIIIQFNLRAELNSQLQSQQKYKTTAASSNKLNTRIKQTKNTTKLIS
jgi:hypothetical protein